MAMPFFLKRVEIPSTLTTSDSQHGELQNPRRRALLFAGRDYLKRLVTEKRFRQLKPEPMTDDCEQRFRQNMATFDGTVLASTAMLTPAQGEGPMLTPLFGDPH